MVLSGGAVGQDGMPMIEGATLGILAGEPDAGALVDKAGKSQCLCRPPIQFFTGADGVVAFLH